jgi:thioredoxin-like negative regulator of GroEL
MFIYFTAPWCVPCKQLGPIMASVAEEVSVLKVNVDEDQSMATDFGVMSIPTVIAVIDGKEVGRFSGARDANFVRRFIDSHVN